MVLKIIIGLYSKNINYEKIQSYKELESEFSFKLPIELSPSSVS